MVSFLSNPFSKISRRLAFKKIEKILNHKLDPLKNLNFFLHGQIQMLITARNVLGFGRDKLK